MRAVAVRTGAGRKVHVILAEEPGYGIMVLGNTACGRYLHGPRMDVDLDEVTTRDVCAVCRRWLVDVA